MSKKFSDILEGWDDLIKKCYGLSDGIYTKTGDTNALKASPDRLELLRLFGDLYNCIETNFSDDIRSDNLHKSNWRLEPMCEMNEDRQKGEKRLEKVIARRAKEWRNQKGGRGGESVTGWYNQMPAASGYFRSRANRKNAIDLVYEIETEREYAFVELKVGIGAGGPFYATYEILSYAFLYLFTRTNSILRERFKPVIDQKSVLKAKTIRLIVLAPESYYRESARTDDLLFAFQESIDVALREFVLRKQPALSMSFEFRRFANPVSTNEEIDRWEGFKPEPFGEPLG